LWPVWRCDDCATILAAAGIRIVTYLFDHKHDPLVFDLLKEAGLTVSQL
jgi:hypothetical protein